MDTVHTVMKNEILVKNSYLHTDIIWNIIRLHSAIGNSLKAKDQPTYTGLQVA